MFDNAELYREIINSIPDIIFRTDENDLIQFINAAASILGYSPDQLACMPLETIIHADDVRRIPGFVIDKRKSMEVRLLPKKPLKQPSSEDDEIIMGELSVMAMLPGTVAGQMSGDGFVGIIRDITRRRKAEELLRKLLSAVDQTPLVIIITDQNRVIEYINPQFIRTTGYLPQEVLGKNVKILKSLYHPPEFYAQMRKSLEGQGEWHGEVVNKKKDGTLYWTALTISNVVDPGGDVTNFISIQEDITEKKRTAKQLKTLREKEVLLREIHHRVKNNLQIITSLANLQTNTIQDEYFVNVFRKFENRIQALALIHEKLYRSVDIARIDFGDYLRSLVSHITQRMSAHPENIHVSIECEKIFFEIDTAIPVGLIVNELVTNAVLHAFDSGEAGELRISLAGRERQYLLEVSDSGRGFPAEVDIHSGGKLGLELVRALVAQLHAELSMSRDKGTAILISIPCTDV